MFGLVDLKDAIVVDESTVECPVRGCREKVVRQRKHFKRQEEYKCSKHKIYISPSTFEYSHESDNLLWKGIEDIELLQQIKEEKRESRMARDNSEDAVTWNVFRFLEKTNLLSELLSKLTGFPTVNPEVIYWSYSQSEKDVWSPLRDARREFETTPRRGSEPDIIVKCDGNLFFIEAKLTSGNDTVFKSKNPNVKEKYESGGGGWHWQAFKSDFETVAVAERKYELLRFWLIGSWIAHLLNIDFYLVNLVLDRNERNIESIFRKHINEGSNRRFLRVSWEDIYRHILKSRAPSEDRDSITRYFKNKTTGYDRKGRLQKAFFT